MIGIVAHLEHWEIMPPVSSEEDILETLRTLVSRGAAECDISAYPGSDPSLGEMIYMIKVLSAYDDGKLGALARSCYELSEGWEAAE